MLLHHSRMLSCQHILGFQPNSFNICNEAPSRAEMYSSSTAMVPFLHVFRLYLVLGFLIKSVVCHDVVPLLTPLLGFHHHASRVFHISLIGSTPLEFRPWTPSCVAQTASTHSHASTLFFISLLGIVRTVQTLTHSTFTCCSRQLCC